MQFISGDELGRSLKEDLFDLCTNPHRAWKTLNTPASKEGPFLSTTLDFVHNIQICKVEGILDMHASILYNLLLDFDQIHRWDEHVSESRVVEEYDCHNGVVYCCYCTSVPSAPRDSVKFRTCNASADNKQFLIGYRSVDHPHVPKKDGYVRMEVFPTGWLLTSVPDDHVKTHCIFILHCDLNVDETDPLLVTNFCTSTMALSHFLMLKKSLQRSAMNHRKQYLSHIATRTYKEICDIFMAKDAKAEGWQRVLRMEPHIDIWSKAMPENRVMCTTGVFNIQVPPEDVFKVLVNLQISGGQDENIITHPVEEIDMTTKVWYLCWKSPDDNRLFDAVIIMYEKITGDTHEIVSRSIIHPKVPVFSNKTRVEILPTGYFVYPSRESPTGSIVSYCFQVDLGLLSDKFNTLEQTFVVRSLGMINALRTKIVNTVPNSKFADLTNKNQPDVFHITETPWKEKMNTLHEQLFDKQHHILSALLDRSQNEILSNLMRHHPVTNNISDENTRQNVKKRKNPEPEYPLIALHDDHKESNDVLQAINTLSPCGHAYRKRPFTFIVSRKSKHKSNYSVNKKSFLEMLPNEILLNILFFLNCQDICRLSCTNKQFKLLAVEESLWKHMYQRRWPAIDEHELRVEYDWKHTFKGRSIIEQNWETGKANMKLLLGHSKAVRALCWNNDFIVSGSSDKTIKLWDTATAECIFTFPGGPAGVIALNLEENVVTAGYKSGLMRSIDITSKICLWEKQFSYWSDGFRFHDSKIASWDQTSIQIWETSNGKLLGSLSDHVKKVTCVELDNIELVSGSTDKTIKKWDLETHKCKTTLQGHSATVNCLDITQNCIASGSNDRTVKLWDGRTQNAASSFSGHVCPVRCVKTNDYMIVSGAADNSLRVWDKRVNGKCILRLEGLNSPVLSLLCDERKIVSGLSEGTIKMWDFTPSRDSNNTILSIGRAVDF